MGKQKNYLGKRVKRGLFQSSTGRLINADVNGAIGILRKVVGDGFLGILLNRGDVCSPIKLEIV
jgi:transposase